MHAKLEEAKSILNECFANFFVHESITFDKSSDCLSAFGGSITLRIATVEVPGVFAKRKKEGYQVEACNEDGFQVYDKSFGDLNHAIEGFMTQMFKYSFRAYYEKNFITPSLAEGMMDPEFY